MVFSARPVSSPGRAETYPPMLMRFLRSNVGSKSRGRSRTSPIFVRRKTQSQSQSAETTQEPSSPKVTCMGQVRIGRSNQCGSRPVRTGTNRRCKWVRNALFCHPFAGKLTPTSFRNGLRKWISFSGVSFRRKSERESRGHSSRSEPILFRRSVPENEQKNRGFEEEGEIALGERNPNFSLSSNSTPPKNALLLMRSRSAPYRSSSLAGRFWGSPSRETEHGESRGVKTLDLKCQRESDSRDSNRESETDAESEKTEERSSGESESSIKENIPKSANTETTTKVLECARSAKLTRCKSEPARTGEKLDPEIALATRRGFGFT